MEEEIIVDLGCGNKKRTKGGKLVTDLTKELCREMLKAQLERVPSNQALEKAWGEFTAFRVIGIDRTKTPDVDVVCNLGYQKIPLEDHSVDYVLAHDFIEHVPFVAGERKPVAFPHRQPWGTFWLPQHRSYWGPETINTFADKFLIFSRYVSTDGKQNILLLKYEL